MNRSGASITLGIVLCLALLPLSTPMLADTARTQLADSPWPTFGQNLQRTGRSSHRGPEHPYLKWSFTTGSSVGSSPAIGADGTIYVGSWDNKLYATSPDGSDRWSFTTGKEILSSPAVGADGTIYVGSWDNNLYAINHDGSERWSFTTGEYISSSPAIGVNGTVYVGSSDGNLYAINPDGSEKWRFTTGAAVDSSPSIGTDDAIYVGSTDNGLYSINPDGTLRWSFPTGDAVLSCPAIGADGTIFVGSFDGRLYAVNSDGTEKWSFATGYWVQSSPAIGADGTVYVGSFDTKLYAITEAPRYSLTVSGSAGGSLTEPGAGEFIYSAGAVVSLAATPDNRYRFVNWTGDTDEIADVNSVSTTITIRGDYSITANFERIPLVSWPVIGTFVVAVAVAGLLIFFVRGIRPAWIEGRRKAARGKRR